MVMSARAAFRRFFVYRVRRIEQSDGTKVRGVEAARDIRELVLDCRFERYEE